jgi:Ca2+-binding RTX toxin-like protein
VAFVTAFTSAGLCSLTNSGTINGALYGASHGGNTEPFELRNSGTISGGTGSFKSTASATDTIINRGTMVGGIWLGLGDDLYDGRGGSVSGLVRGEDGNDTFRPGIGAESYDGGNGIDVLNFSNLASIRISLSASFAGTRTAAGDTYVNIETVTGSLLGNDRLGGDGKANLLVGQGGNDQITAEDGNDTLIGGAGVDRLTGGRHNDRFQFDALSDSGDVITDFKAQVGDLDKIAISAAGFGGGLVAGAVAAGQFITRADNLAQDADDRFIFNTTGRTLWFDIDGAGGQGPVMVADLQAGASLVIGDLLIF